MAVCLLLALGVVLWAHVSFAYLPRERPAVPDLEDLPAKLAQSEAYPIRVWIPYPHQNLGKVSQFMKDSPGFLAAAARLAELPAPVLPSFGPFSVPPARELALAYDPEKRTFILAARIYPVLSVVARLAGWVASNPWLSGGEVRLNDPSASRTVSARISWQGSLWTLSSGGQLPLGGSARPPAGATLGFLSVASSSSPLPAGTYFLERRGGDLRLSLRPGESGPAPPLVTLLPESSPFSQAPAVLVAASLAGGPRGEAPCAIAFLEPTGRTGRFPGAAVLYAPGARRWDLPGEDLASILGLKLYEGQAGPWSLLALDSRSLEGAEALAPSLTRLVQEEATQSLSFGLWLDPQGLLAFAGSFRHLLEQIPLVPAKNVGYWRDLESVLRPLQGLEQVSLLSTTRPVQVELRLWRQESGMP